MNLTQEETEEFENNGYIIIKNVLSDSEINHFASISEKIHIANAKTINHRIVIKDVFDHSSEYLKLINHPQVFPKIWGMLGTNISLYYTHLIVTPPGVNKKTYVFNPLHTSGWHQDGQNINVDIKSPNRPRFSMKAAFYFTDCERPGMGNMVVLPGDFSDSFPDEARIKKAIPVLVNKGDVVVFDRRLWHTSDMNFSNITRKVVFFGYAHRWIAPADSANYEKFHDKVDPVVKQLLRYENRAGAFHNPYLHGDCPLKDFLKVE